MAAPINKFFPLPETPPTDGEAVRLARKLCRYAVGRTIDVRVSRRVKSVAFSRGNTVLSVNPNNGWRDLVQVLAWAFFILANPGVKVSWPDIFALEAKLVREVYKRKYLDGRLKDKPKTPPTKRQEQEQAIRNLERLVKQWESKRKRAVNALKKLEKKRKYYEKRLST